MNIYMKTPVVDFPSSGTTSTLHTTVAGPIRVGTEEPSLSLSLSLSPCPTPSLPIPPSASFSPSLPLYPSLPLHLPLSLSPSLSLHHAKSLAAECRQRCLQCNDVLHA
ncbi:unnamed protein product [Gadus morhua 'NCC']